MPFPRKLAERQLHKDQNQLTFWRDRFHSQLTIHKHPDLTGLYNAARGGGGVARVLSINF